MKKFINDPQDILQETTEGLIAAYHGTVKQVGGYDGIVKVDIPAGKVAVVVGGGSGHEPLFSGFVGENMADAAASGAFFTSPTPDLILATTQAAERGAGVLFVYGNYAGDNLNFDMAVEMAAEAGIETRTVRVWDDVLSAPRARMEERRGISGDIMVMKIAGGAAAAMHDLDEVYRLTAKARDHTRSIGVAAAPGTNPVNGRPFFEIGADEFELGMGVHGEMGVSREKMIAADELVARMVAAIVADLPFAAGDEVCLLINSLGATTYMEMLIINRQIHRLLAGRQIAIYDTLIGHFCGSQEMAGFSITLMKLDDEIKRYYDMPANALGLVKLGR
jgi:dihydroxyacetone kinase-like protein